MTKAVDKMKANPKIGRAEALRGSMLTMIDTGKDSGPLEVATIASDADLGEPLLHSLRKRASRGRTMRTIARHDYCRTTVAASQQESAHHRGIWKAQKIRMRLGGSASMVEPFPDKPKGMHWRTYNRLRRIHDVAEQRSAIGLARFVERLSRRVSLHG